MDNLSAETTETRRRVLVLNQYAVPRSEGGGTRHVDLFSRLHQWQPLILATSRHHGTQRLYKTDDPLFQLIWTPHYRSNGGMRIVGWAIYFVVAIASGLRTPKISLVYASTPHLFAVLAGYIISRLRRLPLIVEVRDLWPEAIASAGLVKPNGLIYCLLEKLEWFLCRRADHIVVVTRGWEDHFIRMGLHEDMLTVITNGTEPTDFAVDTSRDELRSRHRIVGKTAVFAGSHGPKDGIDLIIEAARILPDVNFLLIGSGSVKASAQERVGQMQLENVTFRDMVPKDTLAEVLAAADIGIHAVSNMSVFRSGMSPNKLFDYMAARLPVVSNAGQALSNVLRDGECGRIGKTDDLATCIRDVLAVSDHQRAAWGRNGYEMLCARFTRSEAAHNLERILNAVADNR